MRFALVALIVGVLLAARQARADRRWQRWRRAYTDTAIQGNATFPPQHVDEPSVKGKVIDLTSRADGDHERWNLVIEDEAEQGHSYGIELPPQVVPQVATGSTVTIDASDGKISVIDDQARSSSRSQRCPRAGPSTVPTSTRPTGRSSSCRRRLALVRARRHELSRHRRGAGRDRARAVSYPFAMRWIVVALVSLRASRTRNRSAIS